MSKIRLSETESQGKSMLYLPGGQGNRVKRLENISEKELAMTPYVAIDESTNSFQEAYQKYYKILQLDWKPYVEANNLYADSEKLVAYCTRECAEQTEKAADFALLAVFYVREGLK